MTISEKLKAQLDAIGAKFGVKLSAEPAKVEMMATGSLPDGTKVGSPDEQFSVGSEVFIIAEDGSTTPAPDGEHIVDGVSKIVVADGKITEIETIEPESEEMSAEVKAVVEGLAARIADLETKVSGSTAELAAVTAKLSAAEKKAAEAEAKVTELSKMPATESVKASAAKNEGKKETERKPFGNPNTLEKRILEGIRNISPVKN